MKGRKLLSGAGRYVSRTAYRTGGNGQRPDCASAIAVRAVIGHTVILLSPGKIVKFNDLSTEKYLRGHYLNIQ